MMTAHTLWLRTLAELLLGGGAGVLAVRSVVVHAAFLRARIKAHGRELAKDLRFLRMDLSPRTIQLSQATGILLTLLCLVVGARLCASVLVVLVAAPKPWLHARRVKRVNAIEAQLDGWLQGLASSLRATPSLGEAIAFSKELVSAPLSDELDQLLAEQRLGVPLDDALTHMGDRVASRTVQSGLAALRIGRNTGGDLSTILERSAATLREMARLEGVVRTKTAEGKAQAYVVAVLPFPMIGLFTYLNPSMLAPLVSSFRGYCVALGAFVLWLAAILIARKVLDVDV